LRNHFHISPPATAKKLWSRFSSSCPAGLLADAQTTRAFAQPGRLQMDMAKNTKKYRLAAGVL